MFTASSATSSTASRKTAATAVGIRRASHIFTVNLYANYDMVRQRVCDELEIVIYGGNEDKGIRHLLNAAEKDVLREKMEAYCMEQEHTSLAQFCKEILQDQDTGPAQEMQL